MITIPFGKLHKGKNIEDVPPDFLLWCFEQPWIKKHKEVYKYIKKHREDLEMDAMEESAELYEIFKMDIEGGWK